MTEVSGTKGRILINGQPRLYNIDVSDDSGTRMKGAKHADGRVSALLIPVSNHLMLPIRRKRLHS
ncbi:hypothetical protein V1517DRAFT_332780 [Lipomyces orientalis]|uniref:Uncharacterized protein n=1 Tax=Lipomyces orientalis TaxID=1233043 RepID=A0ACC3TES7_9ASCO